MKVVFTVAVRNPLWFWSKAQMIKEKDSRKEWEVINEGKIDKFNPLWQYEIPLDVKKIEDNRNTEHKINFVSSHNPAEIVPYTLTDVSVVKFIGDTETIEAVVSNSIVHQYFGAKQRGYKHYVYFYISENTEYYHPHEKMIWMSATKKTELEDLLGSSIPV